MFYGLLNLVARFVFWLVARVDIIGRENVPPQGGLMVAINHLSFLDAPLAGVAIPRTIRWMSKIENWDNPFLGAVMTGYGAFPIQRGEPDRKALVRAMTILREGGALGVAPEGHRSTNGRLARAKAGAARLAIHTDTAVLPVAITGTDRAIHEWPRLRRPRITVTIGEPFKIPVEKPISKERQQELADEMMLHLASMLPESYRGVYADGIPGPEVEAYTPPAR